MKASKGALGKCDAEVKTRLPGAVKDDLMIEARRAGMSDSEFLRELIMLRLYGLDEVHSLYRARLQMVAGCVASSGTPVPLGEFE